MNHSSVHTNKHKEINLNKICRESEITILKLLNQLNQLEVLKQSQDLRLRLDELLTRYTQADFLMVVMGQFKRGKTSLINAFLGEPLLPTALIPLTSIVTQIKFGDKQTITVKCTNKTHKSSFKNRAT